MRGVEQCKELLDTCPLGLHHIFVVPTGLDGCNENIRV